MKEMREQTEQTVARWVSGWIEAYEDHDALHDLHFWANIALLTVEVVGSKMKHPAFRYLAEFAPVLKDELARQKSPRKRRARKRATGKNGATQAATHE